MEQNNTNTNEIETSKPVKESKDSKKTEKKSISSLIGEYKGEFRKIVWPSRKDVLKQTATVIVVSLFVGAIIFGMDSAFGFAFDKFISLMA